MKFQTPYSAYKIVHHINVINNLKNNIQSAPVQVQMIISDLCNQDCKFCAYRLENYASNQLFKVIDPITHLVNNNPNRMISKDKCLEILDDCVEIGTKAIQFTGGGEPTVHPHHIEIFTKTLDLGLDLALVTNGMIVKEQLPEILSRSKWVRFSIDSSNSKSYSKIRRTSENSYHKVLNNIEKVVKERNNYKDSDLIIGIGFVVTEDNHSEIYEATKIAKDLGVDNIRITAEFTVKDYTCHDKYYIESRDLARQSKEDFEDSKFVVFNLFGERIQDIIDEQPEYEICGYMHVNTYIGGDLNVYRCCNTAYNKQGLIGSIKEQRFKELWFSEEKINNFNNFKAHSCEKCTFNNKNRLINYMLDENPLHVNYI